MTTIARDLGSTLSPGPAPSNHAVCAHCSLPVPENLRSSARDEKFCCGGCEVAYDSIRACGMEEYYALRDILGADAEPARSAPGRYAELDDPAFAQRHVTDLPGGLRSVEVYVEGLHCAACVWLLERLPTQAQGLRSIEVDLFRRTARICWDAGETSLSSIARLLGRFGYAAHPVEPSVARDTRRNEDRTYLIRIGVAAACAGNVMLLAFALYSGEFSSIGEPYLSLFRWASAAIGLLAVVWPGRVFFAGALAAARARTWHLDMPIALALAVGTAAGLVSVARGTGEIYFDSISTLILLLLIGRWLQIRQQRSAADSIEMLFSVTPRRVSIVRNGAVEEASIDSVCAGDLVEIGPSGCVPVDGVIETGVTSVDNSILSGESRPLPAGPGDAVVAGAVNLGATIRVRVEAAGRETRVGKLMGDIEKLGRSRTPIIGSADRIARPFVLSVLSAVALCVLVQLPAGAEAAVESVVALLIVCCPCAVAMATPLATSITIGRLARRGVLVKGGDCLEALAGRPELVLDKTGTITDGVFGVIGWVGDESMKPIVAALESGGSHPIALALAGCSNPAENVTDIDHRLGLGVVGRTGSETVAAGSSRLATEIGAQIPQWVTDESDEASRNGLTPSSSIGTPKRWRSRF